MNVFDFVPDPANLSPVVYDFSADVCVCGCPDFFVVCRFEDGQIAGWFMQKACVQCHALYQMATSED